MKKTIHTLTRILTVLILLSLILAYLAVWISPAKLWIVAFFGLAYPYLLLISIILLVIWIVAGRIKEAILIFLVILMGWGHLTRFFRIPLKSESAVHAGADTSHQLSVLTYNVRLFNYYNHEPAKTDSMFRFIRSRKADLICLQEIYTGSPDLTESMLIREIGLPYYQINYVGVKNRLTKYGMAVFSRFPIINTGKIDYPDTYNTSMYCDIVSGSDTLRIFNNHLQSTRLNKHRNALNSTQGESLKDFLVISERLKDAFIKRSQQAVTLKNAIEHAPYRVVVCGDFNDTPVSYTYHKIAAGMKDAFLFSGRWLGKTYLGLHPSFRIDYILTSPSMEPFRFVRDKFRYSDHFPVECSIVLDPD